MDALGAVDVGRERQLYARQGPPQGAPPNTAATDATAVAMAGSVPKIAAPRPSQGLERTESPSPAAEAQHQTKLDCLE